jgi:SepF-like predicted cell division protein (DUF552 family)
MSLRDLFKRITSERKIKDIIEFSEQEEPKTDNKLIVRIENINGLEDVERVSGLVKQGNIMFLKVKDLQKKDLGQFQLSVQKLKRICMQWGWDLVGTEDGYLVVTPQFAKIER